MTGKIVVTVLTSLVSILGGWELRTFTGPGGVVIRMLAWLSLIGGVVLLVVGGVELVRGRL